MSNTYEVLLPVVLPGEGELQFPGDESRPAFAVESVAMGQGRSVDRIEAEFWTSAQRQAHPLHEISYRACFKPQLPRYFIERLTRPGDRVFDPFAGRGTTLVEAALLGRRVAANDVNPLSRILVEPRFAPPSHADIRARLDHIPWNPEARADIDLSMFYSPRTEGLLVSLRQYLQSRLDEKSEDDVDRWIRMVATNRLTGHSAGFFSVYTLPPNQAVSPESQRKINAKRNQTPPDRDVAALIERKSRSLLRGLTDEDRRRLTEAGRSAWWSREDARALVSMPDGHVDLVVTSPPFLDIVQYAQDNWLRCWFNAIKVDSVERSITVEGSVEGWTTFMRGTLGELHRILRPGGRVAFEVGEVRGATLRLDEIIAPLGEEVGFLCRAILVNRQTFTKTANCWGVRNNTRGTNTNRIVVLEKTA